MTIRVQSAQGHPVEGAAVYGLPVLTRYRPQEVELGSTSHEGMLHLERDALEVVPGAVLARHDAHSSPCVELEERQTSVTLVLEPTHTLSVHLRDRQGRPVTGFPAILSRGPHPTLRELIARADETGREGPSDLVLHRMISNAEGYGEFNGLLAGNYMLWAASPTHIFLGQPLAGRASVPGPPLKLTVVEPIGAAVDVRGDTSQALRTVTRGGGPDQLIIPIRHGSRVRIPPGRYRVEARRGFQWLRPDVKSVEIHELQRQYVEIRIPHVIRRLRLAPVSTHDERDFSGRVHLWGEGFDKEMRHVASLREKEWTVPEGDVEIHVHVPGCLPFNGTVDTTIQAGVVVVDVPLVRSRDG